MRHAMDAPRIVWDVIEQNALFEAIIDAVQRQGNASGGARM